MSIRNASIPVGATWAPTGGTATPIVMISSDSSSARAFIGTTGVTPLTRSEVQFASKPAKTSANAPGGFTQGRSSAKVVTPKVLTNLARTLNTGTIEISLDPETTSVELAALKSNLVNVLMDADFDQLWLNQSID